MARITNSAAPWLAALSAAALFAAAVIAPAAAGEAVPAGYADSVARARAARIEQLRQPDGYLALTASGWLVAGDNSIGAAADNRFQLPGAPAHLGVLRLAPDGSVSLLLHDRKGVTQAGRPAPASLPMQLQRADGTAPTRVDFAGSYLYVVANGDQRGLRVKNNDAPSRVAFPGLRYFPLDPSWRVQADWVPFKPPRSFRIAYVTGTEESVPVPGKAVFHHAGQTYELQPMSEDGRLFFVFTDRTAGKLTYGGARFLYADLPRDGKLLLDFNLAQNPPCAITVHVVCPLAPAENRLNVAVTAGELKFAEH